MTESNRLIDLVQRLRNPLWCGVLPTTEEAADAIEAQAKEIHELKVELGEWVQFWRDKDNKALKARIEELEDFIKKQYQQTDALKARIVELEAMLKLSADFASKQQSLGKEFEKVLFDNLDYLYVVDPASEKCDE